MTARQQAKVHNFAITYGMTPARGWARCSVANAVKRMWVRAGRPCSLKAWARALEPWNSDVRMWLRGVRSLRSLARGRNAVRPPSRRQKATELARRSAAILIATHYVSQF